MEATSNSSELPSDPSMGVRLALHILFLVILAAISVLGVVGNGLVIWVTGFRMPQNVTKVWFLHLAVADFTFSALLPINIASLASGHWPFGRWLCKLYHVFTMLNMFTSVFLLTLVSLDRCVCILQPLWARKHRTPGRLALMATGAWGLAAAFSSPYLLYRQIFTDPWTGFMYCYNNYNLWAEGVGSGPSEGAVRRYKAHVALNFVVGFAGPLLLICGCSGLSVARLRAGKQSLRSNRPFQVLVAVVTAFFCCWLPLHLVTIWELEGNLANREHPWLRDLATPAFVLASANSCLNPVLYSWVGQNFRRHLPCSVTSALKQALEEDYKGSGNSDPEALELQESRCPRAGPPGLLP
ncbi:formyl peptide receptor-related sequence 4-like [Antechinus flavipes]|uniref:formyl peptide receptor-related sequence 4-like n=1 Tax=Antechinus flavipes TaxID=38775 RepID=UPI002235E3B9|nr:formyl peptide receptor-related sequence 4-like [Antechinus flavipes]